MIAAGTEVIESLYRLSVNTSKHWRELRMPAVVIGTPLGAGSLTAVWEDDAAATASAVEYLAGIGHRRIARVTGIPTLWHTKIRTDALGAAARAEGIESICVAADYTRERG